MGRNKEILESKLDGNLKRKASKARKTVVAPLVRARSKALDNSGSSSKPIGNAVDIPGARTRVATRKRRAPAAGRKVTDCEIINSLARGLKVLSAFGPGDTVLSNKDLAVRTGLPKATISRLTNTLVRLSFLSEDGETSGYRIGNATLTLGLSVTADVDLPQIAQPLMREFAMEHEVAVVLGVRDGLEMRSLAYTCSDWGNYAPQSNKSNVASKEVRVMLPARLPLAASALGYALIGSLSMPERLTLFDQLEMQSGANWPNIRRRIEFAIQDIGRNGYCSSIREWNGTFNSVAVPLPFAQSGIPLSLAGIASTPALPESRIRNSIGPAIVDLERRIRQSVEAHKTAPIMA
jgi:DNA-binding IclR family transcriptional regulator